MSSRSLNLNILLFQMLDSDRTGKTIGTKVGERVTS